MIFDFKKQELSSVGHSHSYKIQRIDLHAFKPDIALLYVIDNNPLALATNYPVVLYCIPISIEKLQELDLTVGSHITLEVKPEGK